MQEIRGNEVCLDALMLPDLSIKKADKNIINLNPNMLPWK